MNESLNSILVINLLLMGISGFSIFLWLLFGKRRWGRSSIPLPVKVFGLVLILSTTATLISLINSFHSR